MNPISRSSEYAIRALTFLAQQPPGSKYFLARDMAAELGIPAAFLCKILQPLVACGMLESQRGRRGGFRLAGRPEEVTLFQIVDAQEALSGQRTCFLGQADCSDERACPMHEYWKEAHLGFEQRLTTTTLADMVDFCAARPDSGYPLPEVAPAPRRRRSKR